MEMEIPETQLQAPGQPPLKFADSALPEGLDEGIGPPRRVENSRFQGIMLPLPEGGDSPAAPALRGGGNRQPTGNRPGTPDSIQGR